MISLDLNKGQLLDLTKYSTSLNKIRLAAGWDINSRRGRGYDLDIGAILVDSKTKKSKLVYFSNMKEQGIYLDKDNLTGIGKGDDENIHIVLSNLNPNFDRIVFVINIYQAKERNQSFQEVENAHVRLVDEGTYPEKEICRYNLTSDGGRNYVCIVGGTG